MSPSKSFVEVEGDEVRVRMARASRADFSRSAVVSFRVYDGKPLSRGVHGWAGRWFVNGSGEGPPDPDEPLDSRTVGRI